jgi:hypothetical protein
MKMITGLKESVARFGNLSAITMIAVGKMEGAKNSGDYKAGVEAAALIKAALAMPVTHEDGNSVREYKLYDNGVGVLA